MENLGEITGPRIVSANVLSQPDNETHFLNVDVDVWAESDLQPLGTALGDNVFVHYVSTEGAEQSAHFSVAGAYGKDADTIIRRLVGAN